jgi:hypothetical protein
MCEHDWRPIPGWTARYRCAVCRVLGCKFGIVRGTGGGAIEPYLCASRSGGAKCGAPAVTGDARALYRCARHPLPRSARADEESENRLTPQ